MGEQPSFLPWNCELSFFPWFCEPTFISWFCELSFVPKFKYNHIRVFDPSKLPLLALANVRLRPLRYRSFYVCSITCGCICFLHEPASSHLDSIEYSSLFLSFAFGRRLKLFVFSVLGVSTLPVSCCVFLWCLCGLAGANCKLECPSYTSMT